MRRTSNWLLCKKNNHIQPDDEGKEKINTEVNNLSQQQELVFINKEMPVCILVLLKQRTDTKLTKHDD